MLETTPRPLLDAQPRAIERQMPSNVEAEQAVLGSLLLDGEAITRILSFLRAADFYLEKHRWIYQVMWDLHDHREPIDILSVISALDTQAHLSAVGGMAYLTSLLNAVPTAAHVEHYAHLVETASLERRLIQTSTEIAELAYDGELDIKDKLEHAEKLVYDVAQHREARDLIPIRKAVDGWADRMERLREHEADLLGVASGFVDLDKVLGGLQKNDLIIVAGRPGSGKTSFALSIAYNVAVKSHKRIAIFSLEMSAAQLVERLISQVADTIASEFPGQYESLRVDSQKLRVGDVSEDQYVILAKAMGELAQAHIYIDESSLVTPIEIRSKARRLSAELNGLDLIVIDYMQLMNDRGRTENRVQEMSNISRQLKFLARDLDVPVVALSQLSRAVESRTDKRPQLSDLRESGSIEQDADVVLMLYREKSYYPTEESWQRAFPNKAYPENIADIIIAKHRHGPTSEFRMFFDEKRAKFGDLAVMPRGNG
ncbi:MAG: replicative DNA helicase [Chloroflexi bacterium]|nr:replicative DNA helicase [Chloroflexota bacterium]